MTEPQKTTEPEALSADALAMIRWQEENPNVWDMSHDDDYDENGVDLVRLRENLKMTPAERLRRAGARMVFEKYGAKTRTIRELGGEIAWVLACERRQSESHTAVRGDWSQEAENGIVDSILSVLACHQNTMVVNDANLPVTPRPNHTF